MTSRGLQVLDEVECYQFLHSRTLGRVGVQVAGRVSVLPVYYAVMEHDVVFRTAPGTKLDAAVLGTEVAFEVDNASPGWSVLVRGHAQEIRDDTTLVHAKSLLGHDWPAGERDRCVRIVTEHISGRRLPPGA